MSWIWAALLFAGGTQDTPLADSIRTFEVELDAQVAKVLTPGPVEPDWSTAGVDLDALLAAQPGGVDGTALIGDAPEMRSLRYFGGRRMVLPRRLKATVVTQGPNAGTGDAAALRMTRNLWLEGSAGIRRVGTARCTFGLGTLWQRSMPGATIDEGERMIGDLAIKMARQLADTEVCSSFRATGDGRYRERLFLPDGRALPGDGDDETYRLAPLDEAVAAVMASPWIDD